MKLDFLDTGTGGNTTFAKASRVHFVLDVVATRIVLTGMLTRRRIPDRQFLT